MPTTIYKIDTQQGPTYSTGNCIQYLTVIYKGKESEKEWLYVYVYSFPGGSDSEESACNAEHLGSYN